MSLCMLKKLHRRFYLFVLFLFLFSAQFAAADNGIGSPSGGIGSPGGGIGSPNGILLSNPLGSSNIIEIINKVINFLIIVSIPLLALFILIGGFQILTAKENPKKLENGKKTIQWAALGFAIILVSKGVALILLRILYSP